MDIGNIILMFFIIYFNGNTMGITYRKLNSLCDLIQEKLDQVEKNNKLVNFRGKYLCDIKGTIVKIEEKYFRISMLVLKFLPNIFS